MSAVAFTPANPDFAERVRDSFGRQPFRAHLSARGAFSGAPTG